VIHFGGGTRAPIEGFPVAGISSQFIFVFLEGVPPGKPSEWSLLPRLEHAPSTPMNIAQRANYLFRQGFSMSVTDHVREEASMSRLLEDTVEAPTSGGAPVAVQCPAPVMSYMYHPYSMYQYAPPYSSWTGGYLPPAYSDGAAASMGKPCLVKSAPPSLGNNGDPLCHSAFEPLSAGGVAARTALAPVRAAKRERLDGDAPAPLLVTTPALNTYREPLAFSGGITGEASAKRPRWSSTRPASPTPRRTAHEPLSLEGTRDSVATQLPDLVKQASRCGICSECMVDAVATSCGHSFCRLCISRELIRRSPTHVSCPVCSSSIAPAGYRIVPPPAMESLRQLAAEAGVSLPKALPVDRLIVHNVPLNAVISAIMADETDSAREAYQERVRQHSHELRVLGLVPPSSAAPTAVLTTTVEDEQIVAEETHLEELAESDGEDSDSVTSGTEPPAPPPPALAPEESSASEYASDMESEAFSECFGM
jgi:hypothetical protein